ITSHLLHRLKIKYQTLRIKNHSLPDLGVKRNLNLIPQLRDPQRSRRIFLTKKTTLPVFTPTLSGLCVLCVSHPRLV
ncbi:MAG: hypothetical protein EBZ78_05630, partial [Verrucomicrobia bacterium]|nr:hypothetical protein [Verrucomicrobiota bacterium]